MNKILRSAISHDQLLGRLAVGFFLILNSLNLALAMFTMTPQWLLFFILLTSFGPYFAYLKFVRHQKLDAWQAKR